MVNQLSSTEILQKSEIPMNKVVQIPYSVDMKNSTPLDDEKKKHEIN